MNKKLIVANWKMNPQTIAEAEQILDSVDEYLGLLEGEEFSLVFCPPFVFTEEVGKILKTSHLSHQAELGAQDIFWDDQGASTGEISGPILKKLGVRYVIIGHSERRWKLDELDEIVNKKLKAALRNELIPIVCLGEKVRDEKFKQFLEKQTLATFNGLSSDEMSRCVIAYEPVWAISTTLGACSNTPELALESLEIIRTILIGSWKLSPKRHSQFGDGAEVRNLPKVLYGGSVSSVNAHDFLEKEEIDGVLIGGASIDKKEFVKILSTVAKL